MEKIKIGRDNILGSHRTVSPGWLAINVNSAGAVCDQKIMVFVLQMKNPRRAHG
jgi:hypothetical protein